MPGTDLKNILIDHWDVSICELGIIDYEDVTPSSQIGYGICIKRLVQDRNASGLNRYEQTTERGGIYYTLDVIGTSDTDIDLQLRVLHKIVSTFADNGRYNQLYLYPDQESIQQQTNGLADPAFPGRVHALLPIHCAMNNQSLTTSPTYT